jgi:hypothetical protein
MQEDDMMSFRSSPLWVLAIAGCDLLKTPCEKDSATSCDTGALDTDADTDTDTDTDADVDLIDDSLLSFSVGTHPCAGNRTDALWADDYSQVFVGCGTTTAGTGLFQTTNGGTDWAEVSGFEDFRVNHLWRSADSGLYVSGNSTVGDARVLGLDEGIETVWNKGATSEMSFSVGAYARSASGVEVAESLTGNGVVVRQPGGTWLSGYGWWNALDSAAVQILDLDSADGAVVGVGNVISQPPVVYLPPRSWSFGEALGDEGRADGLWEMVTMSSSFVGELWDIDGDAHGLVVGGVNQDDGHGVVWTIGTEWDTDAYEASAWHYTDVRTVLSNPSPTWVRGVCRVGDRVAVVGEFSSLGDGFLLISQDGGVSFEDRTAEVEATMSGGSGLGPLHRCQFLADGGLFAGGADGIFVGHRP